MLKLCYIRLPSWCLLVMGSSLLHSRGSIFLGGGFFNRWMISIFNIYRHFHFCYHLGIDDITLLLQLLLVSCQEIFKLCYMFFLLDASWSWVARPENGILISLALWRSIVSRSLWYRMYSYNIVYAPNCKELIYICVRSVTYLLAFYSLITKFRMLMSSDKITTLLFFIPSHQKK